MDFHSLQFRQNGAALVLVLWALSLLSIIAASYALTVRNEILLVSSMMRGSESRALAEAGIWVGVDAIVNDSIEQLYMDGTPFDVMISGAAVQISIEDEIGKIDLNTSDEELLMGLVKTSLIPHQLQTRIVDEIIDWRDRDSVPREKGTEGIIHTATGTRRTTKNDSFSTVEELKQIPSMTPEIYDRLEHLLTVHSQDEGINYQVASRQVLMAVPGITESQADWLYKNRHSEIADVYNAIPAESRRYLHRNDGSAYRIISRAQSGNVVSQLEAIVSHGARGKGISILQWREG